VLLVIIGGAEATLVPTLDVIIMVIGENAPKECREKRCEMDGKMSEFGRDGG